MWGHSKKVVVCKQKRGLSQEPYHAGALIVGFQYPEMLEINVCYHLVDNILLAVWTE